MAWHRPVPAGGRRGGEQASRQQAAPSGEQATAAGQATARQTQARPWRHQRALISAASQRASAGGGFHGVRTAATLVKWQDAPGFEDVAAAVQLVVGDLVRSGS